MQKLREGNANLSEIPKTVAVKFLSEIAQHEKEKNERKVDCFTQTKGPFIKPSSH